MGKILTLPKEFHPEFAVPNRKPVGAVEIDWNNPISGGLKLCIPIIDDQPKNLVNGAVGTIVSGTQDIKEGNRVISSTGSAYIKFTDTATVDSLKDKAGTVLLFGNFKKNTGNSTRVFHIGDWSGWRGIVCEHYAYTNIIMGITACGHLSFNSSTNSVDGASVLGFSWGRISTGQIPFKVIQNNTIQAYTMSGTGASWTGVDTVSIMAGMYSNAATGISGNGSWLDSAFVWDRVLSDAEIKQVIDARFGTILKPANPITYLIPSAGSSPYDAELTTGTFSFSANALTSSVDFTADLSSPSFDLTTEDLAYGTPVENELTAAEVKFAAQDISYSADYDAGLTTASFNFTPNPITITTPTTADVRIQSTRFAVSTATAGNTQDITISGFGTPKAVMFFATLATADDTQVSGGNTIVGFTDGTRSVYTAMSSEDGVTSSNSNRILRQDSCVGILDVATEKGRASFNSWITDGVRIDLDQQFSSAYLITAVFIGGDDVANAYCNYQAMGATVGGTVDITSPGFEPTLVFTANVGGGNLDTVSQHGLLSFGISHNNSDLNRSAEIFDYDGVNPSQTGNYISDEDATQQVYAASADYTAYVTDYDSSGFSYKLSTNHANYDLLIYLAVKLTNDPSIAVVDYSPPTTTGSHNLTGTGFQPDFGMLVSTMCADYYGRTDSPLLTDSSLGFTFLDDDASYTVGASIKDNVSPSVSKSISTGDLTVYSQGDSLAKKASFTGFNSDGASFNYSAVNTANYKWFGLFIAGGAASVPYSADLTSASFNYTPNDLSVTIDYTDDLSSADFDFTAQDLSVGYGFDIELTSDDFIFSAQALNVAEGYRSSLTSASFELVEQDLNVNARYNVDLTSPSFETTAYPLSFDHAFTSRLTVASLNATPLDLNVSKTYEGLLSVGDFEFTANAISVGQVLDIDLTSATFSISAQALQVSKDFLAELSSGSFEFVGYPLSVEAPGGIDLTLANFKFQAQDLLYSAGRTYTLTTATFDQTTYPITTVMPFDGTLTSGSFGFDALSVGITTQFEAALTATGFEFTPQDITLVGGYSVDLSSATFAMTPLDVNILTSRTEQLTAADFSISALDINLIQSYLINLTDTDFVFTPLLLDWEGITPEDEFNRKDVVKEVIHERITREGA